MELKMKNANIMGIHQFLGEGGNEKNNKYGELPKKGALDNLQGAWKKLGRRVFFRGLDTLMQTVN